MMKKNNSSFRDPAGSIYQHNGTIYRTVMPSFADAFNTVRQSGAIDEWISTSKLWPERAIDKSDFEKLNWPLLENVYTLLEHPTFPFISYPYEWPFCLLKEAALFHLDLMQEALSKNIMLNDASAFNVQFNGIHPIFIDHLAFRPYREGEFWQAHKQFFEQFINPLLLQSYCQVGFQPWYRGALAGISTIDLANLLPFKRKWHWQVACHILLQARFDKQASASINKLTTNGVLPRLGLINLWRSLRSWIHGLKDGLASTHWQSYMSSHSYEESGMAKKQAFITEFIRSVQPDLVWDLGCNTGNFSFIALEAGAKRVIGFDHDQGALNIAYQQAKKYNYLFTPLYMDFLNPTPSLGWNEQERLALSQRTKPNAILALALIHHLAITANVPLSFIIDYWLSLAPMGVVEFVPKTDPMVQAMLVKREDIFTDYTFDNFIQLLSAKAKILSTLPLSEGGRVLVAYTATGLCTI